MLQTIINTIKDLIIFIKSPSDKEINDYSKMFLIKTFLILIVLDILIMGAIIVLIDSFIKFGWVKIENHQLAILLELLPIWIVLLLTIIVIPFIEEIIYRLPLRFKSNYLLRLILIITNRKKSGNSNSIIDFWYKKFPFIFYFSTVVFSLIHIFNYDLTSTMFYLFPILIFPQFVLSLFIGYLRVRFNFISGFLLHAFHNSIFIALALLSLNTTTNKLNIDNQVFSLKIEEVNRLNTSSLDLSDDSVRFNGINFKNIVSTLTHKDEYLIEFEQNTILNKHISLTLKNKSILSLNMDSIILNHLSRIYNFKVDSSKITKKIYKLIVYDSLKLSKHSSIKTNGSSRTKNSSTLMTFENVTLEVIARELSRNFKTQFEIADNNHYYLNMKFPSKDFKQLENILKSKYGIIFEQLEKEIEHIHVKFK